MIHFKCDICDTHIHDAAMASATAGRRGIQFRIVIGNGTTDREHPDMAGQPVMDLCPECSDRIGAGSATEQTARLALIDFIRAGLKLEMERQKTPTDWSAVA